MKKKLEKDWKIKTLFEDSRQIYHTQDLAVLWGVSNQNTLYTAIKRYVKRGMLKKIYKGFYSTISIDRIDPFELGLTAIHRYGYVSTETILVREGIIFQEINYITLVSNISKKIEIGKNKFLVRKMKDEFLYNNIGVLENGGKREASLERAVVDMLYFNPNYHFDAKNRIDWQKVEEIKKEIGC